MTASGRQEQNVCIHPEEDAYERRNSDISFKLKERRSIRRQSHTDYRRALGGGWGRCGNRSLHAASRRTLQVDFHDCYAVREEKNLASAKNNRAPPTAQNSRRRL